MHQQVVGYYEYLWIRNKGVTDEGLMSMLPKTFHAEVSYSANKYILNKVGKMGIENWRRKKFHQNNCVIIF